MIWSIQKVTKLTIEHIPRRTMWKARNCASWSGPGSQDIGPQFAVVVWVEGTHHPVPPGEVRRVIAAEKLMVLIVVGDADEWRGRQGQPAAMLVPGMTDDPGDLVVDLMRK